MIITGSVPYKNDLHRMYEIRRIKREFRNKVKIDIQEQNNIIIYTHTYARNEDQSLLNF